VKLKESQLLLFIRYSLVFIFTLVTFCTSTQAQTSLSAHSYYSYLKDSTGSLSAEEALKLVDNRFQKWKYEAAFNQGIAQNVYWFYLPIQNNKDEADKVILKLGNRVNGASLYEINSEGKPILAAKADSYIPIGKRPFSLRYVNFPIQLEARGIKNILLQIDNRGVELNLLISVISADETLRTEQNRHWSYGIYFGVFLFIIIFNFFLYFSLRDKIHLWYNAYVLSAILFLIQDEKFYVEIYPDFLLRYFENAWVPPFSLLLMGTSIRVMQLFIKQEKNNSKYFTLNRILMIACFAVSGVLLLLSFIEQTKVAVLVHSLYMVTNILTAWVIIFILISVYERRKESLAFYYLAAVVLMIIGCVNYYFNHMGLTNIHILQPSGIVVGLAFELTVFSLLLTVRYNNLKREKETAIIVAQESERKRLAQDLHDDLGGTLTGLKFLVASSYLEKENNEAIQKKVLNLLDKAVEDVRTISHNLMPRDFNELGLANVLKDRISQLSISKSIRFSTDIRGDENLMPKERQLYVFRIINELLNNIVRHSKATEVILQMLIYKDITTIQLEDNGIGISADSKMIGTGLKNIHSRVLYLNGMIDIDSGEKGTAIIIKIPTKQ
jgi:signal transduction histidine kinase